MAGITLTNMLSNGSFETNTTGWGAGDTLSRVSNSPVHGEYGT